MESHWDNRTVFVREYERVRFGRQERVRAHWRSKPQQFVLIFSIRLFALSAIFPSSDVH
jgi:hypothetical protein